MVNSTGALYCSRVGARYSELRSRSKEVGLGQDPKIKTRGKADGGRARETGIPPDEGVIDGIRADYRCGSGICLHSACAHLHSPPCALLSPCALLCRSRPLARCALARGCFLSPPFGRLSRCCRLPLLPSFGRCRLSCCCCIDSADALHGCLLDAHCCHRCACQTRSVLGRGASGSDG